MTYPSPTDSIIVPLDVPTPLQALALLDQLPQVNFWKVGLELFISSGGEILKILQEREKRIFLDLKLHDIPNTMAGATGAAKLYEVDFLTVHASAGQGALKAAVEAVGPSSQLQLLAVTLLTSISNRQLAFELRVPLELPEYVLQMAVLAKDAGVPGAVCSPQEASELRRVCGEDFLLVCPGVRPSWAQAKDQRRVMTPREALEAGANYLVIGRPITQAENPVEAWERVVAEVQ
ncbi:orotidine-5'-phosphate decarboxylase [Spirulina sp. CS-785/01]|uniref:orotidine-5'-phosphate decarboxylase n=1 Tax=Spirulina sp. CS-785/01 TaxID=3021716 RepID=UPI00232FEB1C|nr:orotidine-5'-phosphate decarboxylase [Spirulina sp. CS-785/01]MDB9312431.1 orotidine-5'-phosphate decarboxylase [Spirulina sp. CS-785/01]